MATYGGTAEPGADDRDAADADITDATLPGVYTQMRMTRCKETNGMSLETVKVKQSLKPHRSSRRSTANADVSINGAG